MTRLKAIRHHGPVHTEGVCKTDVATISTSHATELFVRCAPDASGTSMGRFRIQARAAYDGLAHALHAAGADLADVVVEKAYFRNLDRDFEAFAEIRRTAYGKRSVQGDRLPATTYLHQPPCRRGRDFELQAYAVVPTSEGLVRVTPLTPSREHVTAKLLEVGQARHLYVANIPGEASATAQPSAFRLQSDRMFDTARRLLHHHGASFRDVVRTWIYLADIDEDYDGLNASRNAFFRREGVRRLPASTGIGSGLHPSGNLCTLDLYALLNPEIAQLEIMTTPTLNEAPEYGSAFSRGMKMALPEETYLFISGTASVDEEGATVHVDDVRGQVERMLLNIEQLLRPHGATWTDLAQAVTYLKSAEYLDLFQQICAEQGLAQVANTIVEADVCRPELLCEMEAIAVLPAGE